MYRTEVAVSLSLATISVSNNSSQLVKSLTNTYSSDVSFKYLHSQKFVELMSTPNILVGTYLQVSDV